MKYRPEIDGLRTIAVVPVVLFHAGFGAVSGGYVGVDIFFVISGYLITSILISDLDRGRFSILRFYERRARRILPALFFVCLVATPIAWVILLPSQFVAFGKSLIAISLFASNFFFWQESGYFDSAAELKPMLHTWSLAVEEQFYLFFPIFLALFWRFGRHVVFAICLIGAFISIGLGEWGARNVPDAAYFLLPTRIWELLAGSLAALILHHRTLASNTYFAGLGIIMIAISIFLYDAQTLFPGYAALLPIAGTVLVILFAGPSTLVGRVLSVKAMVGIGLISYSAYLWHQPLFAFARVYFAQDPQPAIMGALCALTFFLAYVSWKFVEAPFRTPNSIVERQPVVFGLSVSGLLAMVAIGAALQFDNGFQSRFSKVLSGDVEHDEYHALVEAEFVDCDDPAVLATAPKWKDHRRCKQSDHGAIDWILLGDSHAEHLFLGFAKALPDENMAFYIQGDKPYPDRSKFNAIFDALKARKDPANILLSMHYVSRLHKERDLFEGFDATLSALIEAGHRMHLVSDIPRFDIHPRNCLFAADLASARQYCSQHQHESDAQKQMYMPELARLSAKHGVPLLDISETFCAEGICSMVQGDRLFYRDSNHLNIAGSLHVGLALKAMLDGL